MHTKNKIYTNDSLSLNDIWEKQSNTICRPEDIIRAGIDKRIWNKSNYIITKRNSPYSTGKELLSCLYHALVERGVIPKNIPYELASEVFFNKFNIQNKKSVSQPYKTFEKYKNKDAYNAFLELIDYSIKESKLSHEKEFERSIEKYLDEIKLILLSKNRKYGDSALSPIRIFSKSDPLEQIDVRIDDKLSRIRNRSSDEDEDVEKDLIGYLVLRRIAKGLV
jgi:hypothetical protein